MAANMIVCKQHCAVMCLYIEHFADFATKSWRFNFLTFINRAVKVQNTVCYLWWKDESWDIWRFYSHFNDIHMKCPKVGLSQPWRQGSGVITVPWGFTRDIVQWQGNKMQRLTPLVQTDKTFYRRHTASQRVMNW